MTLPSKRKTGFQEGLCFSPGECQNLPSDCLVLGILHLPSSTDLAMSTDSLAGPKRTYKSLERAH